MKTTATQLVTFWTCPFLWHVSYERREPLPVWGTRRRFGNVIHAAIAEYERRGRSLEKGIQALEEQGEGLSAQDHEEARAILAWRHEQARDREGRPILIEGALRAYFREHRLEVRMDRLDGVGPDFLLTEYKGGRSVDLELVRVQLLILSYAIQDVFGRPPARWEVELLRARKILELPAERELRTLRGFTGGLIERILEGDREPRPYTASFCTRCPARAYCPRWSRSPKPLSHAAPKGEGQRTLF
jgi:hypothetical protein